MGGRDGYVVNKMAAVTAVTAREPAVDVDKLGTTAAVVRAAPLDDVTDEEAAVRMKERREVARRVNIMVSNVGNRILHVEPLLTLLA